MPSYRLPISCIPNKNPNMKTESHTSSLALSLLRHSCLPSESFVLSPFSLCTALSILHDGADGTTQEELTKLLLNRTPDEVTQFYSSLALSLPSTSENGVLLKSATRFFVDDSISLKKEFQKDIEDKYHVKVGNLKLSCKVDAANEMNAFVEEATDGKIKDSIQAETISDGAKAYLINAIYLLGKWSTPFDLHDTHKRIFNGHSGSREMDFMKKAGYFHVHEKNNFGTALLLGYDDKKHLQSRFNFFFLMPKKSSNLEKMRNKITGDDLLNILKKAKLRYNEITVPKIKIESKLNGIDFLKKLGVNTIFNQDADFSKISDSPLFVSKIIHSTIIETDEFGTEAASSTEVEMMLTGGCIVRTPIIFDRPFLFGILDNDHIIFIGQFV
ncbi:hypothetical protein PMAYCL1PPCAC_26704 [Pristionchus mayeri]|uniref:Serpin domain-containing protein n=1 Tax=Pristionchus mayeri TaxID=1317129 RepID=A0AAN5D4Z7_9BILA|nr:hypothetical protein PMAYCL1PPCAC_26704 [Pristionchus mayeri]